MDYQHIITIWKSEETLDEALRSELLQMDEDALNEAFFQDLAFGTGGMRGLMGVGTNRINIYTIRKAALGFGRYLRGLARPGSIVISYDNRHQSRTFAFESAHVLAALGFECQVFESLRPTPMLSFAVRHFHAVGGIMITASHNPKTYNGFKAYNHTGAQLNLDEAEAVIAEISQITDIFGIKTSAQGQISLITDDFDKIYLDTIAPVCAREVSNNIRIVYSPLHGTGGTVIPRFLSAKGYDVKPYWPEMDPDPDFTNVISSNPEDPKSFVNTIRYAKEISAELILVTDPDADRLGVAVKHQDTFVLLSGNETAALELYYLLLNRQNAGTLPSDGIVYTTVVTTDLIETIASSFGLKTIRTLTGFKFIGEQIELNHDTSTFVFGCEESYGSLISDVVRDKDAVQAVCLLAEMANHQKAQGKTLLDLLDDVSERFGAHAELTTSINLEGLEGLHKIHRIMNAIRTTPPKVNAKGPIRTIDYLTGTSTGSDRAETTGLPVSDVIKYVYDDTTWVVLRPSGTEPKLKIYVGTKARTMIEAKTKARHVSQMIGTMIKTISPGGPQ